MYVATYRYICMYHIACVQVITAYSVTYDTYTTINHDMYAYIIYLFKFVHYIITSIQTNKNDYSTLLQSTVYSLQSTVSF
jgi:hypothetical protein